MIRQLLTPRFLIAILVLCVSAASLKAFIRWSNYILIKEPIYLRRGLELIPSTVGPYEIVEREERLSKDMEEALGTDEYISWVYRDTRKEPNEPGALVRVHVPYYTGTIDTVPHVPDRCFVAGGAEATGVTFQTVELASPQLVDQPDGHVRALTAAGQVVMMPGRQIPLSVVMFARPDAPDQPYGVSYFFVVNNTYTATPEGVRVKALDLTNRFAYHCKVEVMPYGASDAAETAALAREFLSYMLPEIFNCLPDWEAANAAPAETGESNGER